MQNNGTACFLCQIIILWIPSMLFLVSEHLPGQGELFFELQLHFDIILHLEKGGKFRITLFIN